MNTCRWAVICISSVYLIQVPLESALIKSTQFCIHPLMMNFMSLRPNWLWDSSIGKVGHLPMGGLVFRLTLWSPAPPFCMLKYPLAREPKLTLMHPKAQNKVLYVYLIVYEYLNEVCRKKCLDYSITVKLYIQGKFNTLLKLTDMMV